MENFCYFCHIKRSLNEFLEVEEILGNKSENELEDIYDEMPSIKFNQVQEKFTHIGEFHYPIINICKKCLEKYTK